MKRIKWVGLLFVLLLAAGCGAKQTTFADNMRGVATEWDKGNQLIKSGEEQVKKGEQQHRQAEELTAVAKSNVEKGESKIRDGKVLIQTIEREHPESLQEFR